jgi:uncharacterized repeat protein (TIGR03803 family)
MFNGANGAMPECGALIADTSENLYGTTYNGGAFGGGTVFEVAAGTHTLNTRISFTDGFNNGARAGLIADASGNLYGTTFQGQNKGQNKGREWAGVFSSRRAARFC